MTFKKRIFISNLSIVFIPVIMAFISMYIYWFAIIPIDNTKFRLEDTLYYLNVEAKLVSVSEYIHYSEVDELLDEKVQLNLSRILSDIDGKYYLSKDGKEISSTIYLSKEDIQKSIMAAENPFERFISISKTKYHVRFFRLLFSDGTSGELLLFAPMKDNAKYYYISVIVGALTFFITFIIINILVYYLLKKGFVNPLIQLKNATVKITEGDLNFNIAENGDEEIKTLCRAFEEMRLKLKESVDLKLKYEENRKVLITSISHDLKTPITSIKGYVEGLLDGVADTEEKKEKYLKIIHEKAILTDLLIDDLLLYSKLDLNQMPFDFQEIKIVDLLEDIVLEYKLIHKNFDFNLINSLIHIGTPIINGDAGKLTRAFTNIINNSIKYMDKDKGAIEVKIRQNENNYIIEFNDNGPGIPQKDLSLIFSQFYRGDLSRKSGSGTGLGLAISKQIIELHNGHIWVVSDEGKGTSVRVSMPIYKNRLNGGKA